MKEISIQKKTRVIGGAAGLICAIILVCGAVWAEKDAERSAAEAD